MVRGDGSPEKGERGRWRTGKEKALTRRRGKKIYIYITSSKLHPQKYKCTKSEKFMLNDIFSHFCKVKEQIVVIEGDSKR